MRPRYVCSIRTPRARRVCSHRTCSDTGPCGAQTSAADGNCVVDVEHRREGILNENAPVSPLMQAPGALLVPGAARPGQVRLSRRCARHRPGSSRQYRPCGSPASDAYAAYKGRSCEQGAQDGRGKSSPKHLASIGLQDPACGPRILRRERGVGPSTTYWSVSVLHRPHLLIPPSWRRLTSKQLRPTFKRVFPLVKVAFMAPAVPPRPHVVRKRGTHRRDELSMVRP